MAIRGAKLIFGQNWDFVPKRKKKSCLFCIPSILFVQEKVPFFLVIGDFWCDFQWLCCLGLGNTRHIATKSQKNYRSPTHSTNHEGILKAVCERCEESSNHSKESMILDRNVVVRIIPLTFPDQARWPPPEPIYRLHHLDDNEEEAPILLLQVRACLLMVRLTSMNCRWPGKGSSTREQRFPAELTGIFSVPSTLKIYLDLTPVSS